MQNIQVFRNSKTGFNVPFGHLIYDLETGITIQQPTPLTSDYYKDNGYFEVLVVDAPSFDFKKERLSNPVETTDAEAKTITIYYNVIPLTLDEVRKKAVFSLKLAYETLMQQGFACKNSIKIRCTTFDLQTLRSGQELAVACSQSTMKVKDFDGIRHEIATPDVLAMLIEAGLFNHNKWQALQDAIESVNAETDVNKIIILF